MVDFLRNSLLLGIFLTFLIGVTFSEKIFSEPECVTDDKSDVRFQGGGFPGQDEKIDDNITRYHVYTQYLSVPHHGNIVYIDIIQNLQVEIILGENNQNEEYVEFQLDTITPYSDHTPDVYIYHTTQQLDTGLHISLHVTEQSSKASNTGNVVTLVLVNVLVVMATCYLYKIMMQKSSRFICDQGFGTTRKLDTSQIPSSMSEIEVSEDSATGINNYGKHFYKNWFYGFWSDGLTESLTKNVGTFTTSQNEFKSYKFSNASTEIEKPARKLKSCIHGDQNNKMGILSNQRLKSLPLPVWFCLCATLTIAVVFAWRVASSRHVLKVGIPNSVFVRKVRSYSEHQDLAGISINTSSISLITRVQLIDVEDSCKNNLTSCHTHAICDTDTGTLNCICKRGYYVDKQKCKACSNSCPDSYYMSEPCTTHRNVVCKACTECGKTAYEAAPCRTTHDRLCLDVSFPVNHIKWSGTSPTLTNTSIDTMSSSNVFIDKVRNIKNLETTVYVTNNQQSMEFVWNRPSGLEIKIKVSEIFLVPSYVDLDHIDDSPFFITYREPMADLKERYTAIQSSYCRHPLPDHYKMILEIIRNFTSAASYTSCDSSSNSPRCQDMYKVNNKYLNREIGKQCPKSQTSFEKLKLHPNVIYCPYVTSLLTTTFGLTPTEVEALTFPTPECRALKQECIKCVHDSTCPNNQDVDEDGDCCSIPCYSNTDCREAFSSACPNLPVECAAGDVYMFILEPLFEMLGRQYMCHLKYRKPIQLYQVDYHVTIPSLKYSFQRKQHIVKAKNETMHQHGKVKFDFISVEHDSFPEIHKEVIMIGNRFDKNHSANKFTIYPLKSPSQFNRRKKFHVRSGREDPHRKVYSTHVQLERPFLYSSSVWHRDGCSNKNFSQFYPAQHLYKKDPIEVDPTILKTPDYFEYQITPINGVPYIRFHISGDDSILKHYKDDFSKAHIVGSSIHGNLEWNHDNQTWLMSINGTLSVCPAYLIADVYDKYMVAHLGHYDIFVKCPSVFQLSFILQQPRNDTPDVFIVIVNDSSTSHRLVLSHIEEPIMLSVQEKNSLILMTASEYPWLPMIITFVLTVIILTAFLLIGVYIGNKKPENRGKIVKYCETVTFISKDDDSSKLDTSARNYTRPISKGVICVLVTLYLLYAFIFTFSMMLGIFYMFQGSLVMNLTIVSNTSAKVQEVVEKHFHQNENFEKLQADLMFVQTNERLEACSNHIHSRLQSFMGQLDKMTQDHLSEIYSKNKTLNNLINRNLESKSSKVEKKLDSFIEECNKTIQGHYRNILRIYVDFLKQLPANGWMQFPLQTFISQMDTVETSLNQNSLIEYMSWLEVDKVHDVLDIQDKLLIRLLKSFSKSDIIRSKILEWETTPDNGKTEEVFFKQLQHYDVLPQETIIDSGLSTVPFNRSSVKNSHSDDWKSSDKASLINQLKSVFFPVFIAVFLFMDALLLMYRFSWLRQVFATARLGMEDKVPTDHVARKIHFILTGNDLERSNSILDNPYNYYKENKESILAGKHELYLLYCRASPKSKEDILREIWDHKMRQKQKSSPQPENGNFDYMCVKFLKYLYKYLISPILWRFVLVGVFVLLLCLVTKATSDIVTIETATFLMDTNSILPQVHRQISITNNMLSDLMGSLNEQLQVYQGLMDNKIHGINQFLKDTLLQQNYALQSIVVDICLDKGGNSCMDLLPRINITDMIVGCQFLPLNTQLLTDFNDENFMHFLHSELFPLVSTLRTLLFNTCYILFAYACFMLICHMFIRLIILYLLKNKQLPKKVMFLVSNANDCWKENQSNVPKDSLYRSNSWIESCESGVVGDIDDHLRESNI